MPTDVYVASFGHSDTTHGIRPGWRYDAMSDARTWCGIPGSFGVEHRASGAHSEITCRNCARSGNRFRDLGITVVRSRYYVQSDDVDTWTTDPHGFDSERMTWDDDMREDYPDPVAWAVAMLRNERIVSTPGMCGFPALSPSCYPIGETVPAHAWLSGTARDNYTTEETEWSVRLPAVWSPSERAQVFRAVTTY